MKEKIKERFICGGCDKKSDDAIYKKDVQNFFNTFTTEFKVLKTNIKGMGSWVLVCNNCGWFNK